MAFIPEQAQHKIGFHAREQLVYPSHFRETTNVSLTKFPEVDRVKYIRASNSVYRQMSEPDIKIPLDCSQVDAKFLRQVARNQFRTRIELYEDLRQAVNKRVMCRVGHASSAEYLVHVTPNPLENNLMQRLRRHNLSLTAFTIDLSLPERSTNMFWFIVMAGGLAALFATLGAYSVWLKVMSAALMIALSVILGLLVIYGYRKLFPTRWTKADGA